MFGGLGIAGSSAEALYYLRSYAVVLILGVVGSTPLVAGTARRIAATRTGERIMTVAEPLVLCVLLIVVTACLVDGSFNPFIYFRF